MQKSWLPARHLSFVTSSHTPPRCSLFGFAPGGVCRAGRVTSTAGALLPHRFTLTARRPKTGARPSRGGLLSVALSLALRPVDVIDHPVLWSPDFPLAANDFRPSPPATIQPTPKPCLTICESHPDRKPPQRRGPFIGRCSQSCKIWASLSLRPDRQRSGTGLGRCATVARRATAELPHRSSAASFKTSRGRTEIPLH